MGVKALAQYAVLGQDDFVNIVEAPNNSAIVRVLVELGVPRHSPGHLPIRHASR